MATWVCLTLVEELINYKYFGSRDPEWADVKLAQAKYLLSRLAKFKTLVSDRYECIPEVIVAGDFNSQPGDMVLAFLKSQLLYFCLKSNVPVLLLYSYLAQLLSWNLTRPCVMH